MKAAIVAPGKLLLDEGGALYLGGKGYEVVRVKTAWKKYPWASHSLTLITGDKKSRADALLRMVREYSDFVNAT